MVLRFSRARRPFVLVVAAVVLAACVPIQHVAGGGDHPDDYGAPVGDQPVRQGGS